MKRTLPMVIVMGLVAISLSALSVHFQGVEYTVAATELYDVNDNGLSDFYARTPNNGILLFEQRTTDSDIYERITEPAEHNNTENQTGHECGNVDLKPPPPPPPPPPDIDVLRAGSTEAFPNPFNPGTYIRFDLNQPALVKVSIYNQRGQLVTELVKDALRDGSHEFYWNGEDNSGKGVASGIYFFRVATGKESITRKIMLLK